jgi:hypothetical protein
VKKNEGPELLIGVGEKPRGKGMPDEEGADDDPVDMGDEKDMHLDAAYDALKSGDKEGFREAMKKCLLAADEGDYIGPDEGDEE